MTDWQSQRGRVRDWTNRRRSELIDELGGSCQACSALDGLQLCLREPDGIDAARLSRHGRLARIAREARCGNVVLLCIQCRASRPRERHSNGS